MEKPLANAGGFLLRRFDRVFCCSGPTRPEAGKEPFLWQQLPLLSMPSYIKFMKNGIIISP